MGLDNGETMSPQQYKRSTTGIHCQILGITAASEIWQKDEDEDAGVGGMNTTREQPCLANAQDILVEEVPRDVMMPNLEEAPGGTDNDSDRDDGPNSKSTTRGAT